MRMSTRGTRPRQRMAYDDQNLHHNFSSNPHLNHQHNQLPYPQRHTASHLPGYFNSPTTNRVGSSINPNLTPGMPPNIYNTPNAMNMQLSGHTPRHALPVNVSSHLSQNARNSPHLTNEHLRTYNSANHTTTPSQNTNISNIPSNISTQIGPNNRILERQMLHPAHNRLIFNANSQNSNFLANNNNANNTQGNFNPNLTRATGPFYGGYSKNSGIIPKAPKQPVKPLNANNKYGLKVYEKIKAEKPKLKNWEINKEANAMWKELSQYEKQPYTDEAEIEKQAYNEQMAEYHRSPEYQTWQTYLNANRLQVDLEQVTDGRFKGADLDELYAIEPARELNKSRIQINPNGPFDGVDNELDFAEIASKRFKKNHELMLQIFDDRYVGRGWGSDTSSVQIAIQSKFDKNDVMKGEANWFGAGSICNFPTVNQLNRLKNRTNSLQNLIDSQKELIENYVIDDKKRKSDYQERSKLLNHKWKDICEEKPEITYKKWKDQHDLQIEQYQKQKVLVEEANLVNGARVGPAKEKVPLIAENNTATVLVGSSQKPQNIPELNSEIKRKSIEDSKKIIVNIPEVTKSTLDVNQKDTKNGNEQSTKIGIPKKP